MASCKRVLPSQVARLVYGYLSDGSKEIATEFLRKSPYLAECCEIFDEGETFFTDFMGLSLKELIQEYAFIVFIVESKVKLLQDEQLDGRKLTEKLSMLLEVDVPDFNRSRSGSLRLGELRRTNSKCSLRFPSVRSSSQVDSGSASDCGSSVPLSLSSSPTKPARTESCLQPETCNAQLYTDLRATCSNTNARQPNTDDVTNQSHATQVNISQSLQAVKAKDQIETQRPPVTALVTQGARAETQQPRELVEATQNGRAGTQMQETLTSGTLTAAATHVNRAGLQSIAPGSPRGPVPAVLTQGAQWPEDAVAAVVAMECEVAAASPNVRRGVDKDTFFSNMELERDGEVSQTGSVNSHVSTKQLLGNLSLLSTVRRFQLTRSRSCGDLALEVDGSSKRRLRGRPKFFTPHKRPSEEPSAEAIKVMMREMLNDRELHEKLARGINQAWEEVAVEPKTDELDRAIQSIIEKTTEDPVFYDDIMNTTLGNFDLLTYLKPAAKRVASVKERPATASLTPLTAVTEVTKTVARRPSRRREDNPTTKLRARAGKNVSCEAPATRIGGPVTLDNLAIAERVPYPEIRYDPADCNIVTGSLDADGNCVFYSGPSVAHRSGDVMLPPAPHQPNPRYRNIVPRLDPTVTLRDIHPVVVCTPVMPPPVQKLILPKPRAPRPKPASKKKPPEPSPHKVMPATPGPSCVDNMPAINFFATPQLPPPPPNEPESPPAPPMVTPIAPPASAPRRQSLSTPRRKSYIRALEFETPQKTAEEKKSATSPKTKDPPSAKRTPEMKELVSESVKPPAKRAAFESPRTGPPIATRAPVSTPLSKVWDDLTGVGCVLGQSSEAPTDPKTRLDSSVDTTVNSVNPSSSSKPTACVWDTNLRFNLSETELERPEVPAPRTVKRPRNAKPRKRKIKPKSPKKKTKGDGTLSPVTRRVTRSKTIIISPSKMSNTSKRSTYSISHGSSSAFDTSSSGEEQATLIEVVDTTVKATGLVEMTPAKEDDLAVVNEETPFTKLLRENVSSVDIDLSMIQTPFFPATPALLPDALTPLHSTLTPLHCTRATDYSSSSSYYKPELTSPASCLKDNLGITLETVEELQRSEEFLQDVSTVSGRNLVFSPGRKDSGAVKQNKITDYYQANETLFPVRTEEGEVDVDIVSSSPQHSPDTGVGANQVKSPICQPVEVASTVASTVQPEPQAQSQASPGKKAATLHKIIESFKASANKNNPVKTPLEVAKKPSKKKPEPSLEKKPRPGGNVRKDTKIKQVPKLVEIPVEAQLASNEAKIKDIVNEGKRISARRAASGKNMCFLKLQMIAECDLKLGKNIAMIDKENTTEKSEEPKEEEVLVEEGEERRQNNLRRELEIKRLNMVEKFKESEKKPVKRSRGPLERPPKRIRVSTKEAFAGPLVSSTPNKPAAHPPQANKAKPDSPLKSPRHSNEPLEHANGSIEKSKSFSKKPRLSDKMGEEAKKEIPSFVDDGEFPELNTTTKKKLHVIKSILQRPEVVEYLNNFAKSPNPKINLKPCIHKLFEILFKWLKHPHQHEMDASPLVREKIVLNLELFTKISKGVHGKKVAPLGSMYQDYKNSGNYSSDGGSSIDSRVGEKWNKSVVKLKRPSRAQGKARARSRTKEEAPLPLKKRRNPADDGPQPTEAPTEPAVTSVISSNDNNVTHAQIILQDVDVDRFLSRVHGPESS